MSNKPDDIINEGSDSQKRSKLRELQDELYADDAFEKDSAEGLKKFDSYKLPGTIERLNAQLQSQITKKKRKRRKSGSDQYIYITVCVILLLIIVAYVVVRKLHHQ